MNESTTLAAVDALERMLAPADEAPVQRVRYPFEFRGTGAEYFRIWIVNLLLTILTLGIFSAWAKVRRLRYFYGNTLLDGHSFEYHARPMAILRGRLIVVAGYVLFWISSQFYPKLLFGVIPLIVIGMPWILLRSRRFQMRMTSWRNLRFGFGGRYGAAMGAYMGWWLIAAAALGIMVTVPMNERFILIICGIVTLLYPFWVHKKVEYTLDNSSYGQVEFGFFTSAGRFYLFCVATAVMSVVAYFGFIYLFFKLDSVLDTLGGGLANGETLSPLDIVIASGPAGWAVLLTAALTGYAIAGFYQSQLINHSFRGISLGINFLESKLSAARLSWLNITNLLGIIFTLGVYYPWAKVRLVRYQLENMGIDATGKFAEFLAATHPDTSAVGEEASDFFNVDLGI
jgi:uncharacterized membrane protein YjgN (DUF898 family)